MDATELLAREHEFKKLNKQLEKKTETLMKEIENVMQKQDIFSEFSGHLTLSPVRRQTNRHCCDAPKIRTPEKEITKKERTNKREDGDKKNYLDRNMDNIKPKVNCNCCFLSENKLKNTDLEFLYAFVSVNVKDKVLPQSLLRDDITVESVCKFLSAKVKLMQEQIDKLQSTIDKKVKQCECHMTQLAELESERMTLLNKMNNNNAETADVKAKYGVVASKLSEKERLYLEQRSMTDKVTTELKHIKARNISLEGKCASQEETIANLKHQLDVSKMEGKEFRDSVRSASSSSQTTVTNLESKIKMLTSHINKQTSLIDNLKKQNGLLRTEAALKVFEKNYNNFLNQDL